MAEVLIIPDLFLEVAMKSDYLSTCTVYVHIF